MMKVVKVIASRTRCFWCILVFAVERAGESKFPCAMIELSWVGYYYRITKIDLRQCPHGEQRSKNQQRERRISGNGRDSRSRERKRLVGA
eukprot:3093280-Rhodomonas_salina.1